jgi:hypothetical protein
MAVVIGSHSVILPCVSNNQLTKTKETVWRVYPFKINVLLKGMGYVRRIHRLFRCCEHAVKFNKSNTTPRSRVITLNVVFISARPETSA